jgi:hypothetical protein
VKSGDKKRGFTVRRRLCPGEKDLEKGSGGKKTEKGKKKGEETDKRKGEEPK